MSSRLRNCHVNCCKRQSNMFVVQFFFALFFHFFHQKNKKKCAAWFEELIPKWLIKSLIISFCFFFWKKGWEIQVGFLLQREKERWHLLWRHTLTVNWIFGKCWHITQILWIRHITLKELLLKEVMKRNLSHGITPKRSHFFFLFVKSFLLFEFNFGFFRTLIWPWVISGASSIKYSKFLLIGSVIMSVTFLMFFWKNNAFFLVFFVF